MRWWRRGERLELDGEQMVPTVTEILNGPGPLPPDFRKHADAICDQLARDLDLPPELTVEYDTSPLQSVKPRVCERCGMDETGEPAFTVPLEDTSPVLIDALVRLGDSYGPRGVSETAQQLTQRPRVRPSVDMVRLRMTTDAAVWAEEFAKVCPEVDRGLMIGWFANAIETAKSLV